MIFFVLMMNMFVSFSCVLDFHVIMLKREQVEGRIRDVRFPRRVEVALHVRVLDVKCVVSQAAIARLALIPQKLESPYYLSIYGNLNGHILPTLEPMHLLIPDIIFEAFNLNLHFTFKNLIPLLLHQ